MSRTRQYTCPGKRREVRPKKVNPAVEALIHLSPDAKVGCGMEGMTLTQPRFGGALADGIGGLLLVFHPLTSHEPTILCLGGGSRMAVLVFGAWCQTGSSVLGEHIYAIIMT